MHISVTNHELFHWCFHRVSHWSRKEIPDPQQAQRQRRVLMDDRPGTAGVWGHRYHHRWGRHKHVQIVMLWWSVIRNIKVRKKMDACQIGKDKNSRGLMRYCQDATTKWLIRRLNRKRQGRGIFWWLPSLFTRMSFCELIYSVFSQTKTVLKVYDRKCY